MMTPLALHDTVQRISDLMETEIDGDLVLLSLTTNKYYGMAVTGTRIWALLEQPTTPEQIIQTLIQKFQVDRETCERETLHFLNDLAQESLLHVQRADAMTHSS